MEFRFVHLYAHPEPSNLSAREVAAEISKYFPTCQIDVRKPFLEYWSFDSRKERTELARISDLKQPFEKQSNQERSTENAGSLYDGFVLQRHFASAISEEESQMRHVHILFTNLLTCTFSDEDWRYHARAVICGTPTIISSSGIVEAPAKPKEFYTLRYDDANFATLKKQFAGRFIDYGDDRISSVATGYSLQALFYFILEGEPFCDRKDCRLLNAHWQEDLIRSQVMEPSLCPKHRELANIFNQRNL